jgi:hypothetical protein
MQEEALQTIPFIRDPEKLWRRLGYAGLPKGVRRKLVRRLRQRSPHGELAKRKAYAAGSVSADIAKSLETLETHGLLRPVTGLDGDPPALAAKLLQVARAALARGQEGYAGNSRKHSFLVRLAKDSFFVNHPDVLQFVSQPKLVDLASHYLGELPILSSVELWWSPVNQSAQSSQLFHFDEEDDRQLKFFLNVVDIGPENGPFTAIDAVSSGAFLSAGGKHHGRHTDSFVFAKAGASSPQPFVGPAGSIAAVDTSRCLHFGSRGNTADRFVLMFQFVRFSAPLGHLPEWGDQIGRVVAGFEPSRRRIFQIT